MSGGAFYTVVAAAEDASDHHSDYDTQRQPQTGLAERHARHCAKSCSQGDADTCVVALGRGFHNHSFLLVWGGHS